MRPVLAIDFGSTYTKAVLVDLAAAEVAAVAQTPSTVATDITVGLGRVLKDLESRTRVDVRRVRAFACSSAAGGLRVSVSGLVPSLSLEAARRAALGAGAKIVSSHGYKLSAEALDEIADLAPDIVVLAGGTDGGDEETILHNARALAASGLAVPIVVAGNQCVAQDCIALLSAANKPVRSARNLLPEVGRTEVHSVHETIRDIFITRITHAKGIDGVSEHLQLATAIVPTPSAVLEATRLVAEGTPHHEGFGDTVVVDIGGATTDVHSGASGTPTLPGVVQRGLPELWLKRTVEGDLGMRINAQTIVERYGCSRVLELARSTGFMGSELSDEAVERYARFVSERPEYVPANPEESCLDQALGRAAVRIAIGRHAGSVREVYTPTGGVLVQEGKDLGAVAAVIGVGGVLAHADDARFILEGAVSTGTDPQRLLPRNPAMYVDRRYVLFAVGLLAGSEPDAALALARRYLERIPSQS